MVNIAVNFYPPFLFYTNKKHSSLMLQEGAKFRDLLKQLINDFPEIVELIPDFKDECIFYNNVIPVINSNLVSLDEVLKDGDTIDFFGSISGG